MTSGGEGVLPLRGGRAPNAQVGSASGLGKPLDLSNAALEQAAQVTPIDVATAQAIWRHAAPKRLSSLLDATPES